MGAQKMNTRMTKAAFVGTALVALSLGATSAQAAVATAAGKANVLQEITVTKTSDLDFATIVVGTSASTVDVATDGTRTCGAVACTGTATTAAFDVSGTSGSVVTVSVPASLTLVSGANNMSTTLVASASTLTLAGGDSFTVGGTLSLAGSQPSGLYTANFDATVNYQ
jgi:Mat/Ecp fimbriae major subunit